MATRMLRNKLGHFVRPITGSKKRRAPASSKSRRKPGKRRAPASVIAAPRRRSSGSNDNGVVRLLKAALPRVVGIALAGAVVRAAPRLADTVAKRAMLVGGVAIAAKMFSSPLSRLAGGFVAPKTISDVAEGLGIDATFRATAPIRARIPLLGGGGGPTGGLLSGRGAPTTRSNAIRDYQVP